MTFDKGGNISKYKNINWFSQKTQLDFVHGIIFRDRSKNSASFKIELFATW